MGHGGHTENADGKGDKGNDAAPINTHVISELADTLTSRVDLREAFPASPRLVIQESLPYIIILLLTVVAFTYLNLSSPLSGSGLSSEGMRTLGGTFYSIVVLVCGTKIIYEFACYLLIQYSIELEHLTIIRGLLFRTRSSFPIARINDVSLHRSPIQILLGLYTLTILTASPSSVYGSIEGLSARSAHGLQAYLLALLETTLPAVKEHDAEKSIINNAAEIDHSPGEGIVRTTED